MNTCILITGATSGIGLEMAKQLAAKGYDLVLTGRNEQKTAAVVNGIKTSYNIDVRYYIADLSDTAQAQKLYDAIKADGLTIEALVNNAGVGLYGNFTELSAEEQLAMIRLNVNSLVLLTHLFARDMKARGGGKIMNVASLLSFLPFPYYSVYAATKAFVLAFSETIAAELEGTGVVVTALCPGPVDTAFTTKEMLDTSGYKANKPMAVDKVALAGVELLLHGKGKKIVGFNNWFISNLPRILPDKLMMRIKKRLASKG